MQAGCNTVGNLIQFAVCDTFVAEDNRYVVRRFRYLRTEEREDGLGVIVRHLGLVEGIEERCLLFIYQRDGAQRGFGIHSERTHGIAYRVCERLHHLAAVPTVIILNHHRRLSVDLRDIESNLEFRYVEFHVLREEFPSLDLIVGQDANLVGVHDLRREVIICRNPGERIVLVGERLLEVLSGLTDESEDITATDLGAERKGVDEHTHGVRHLEVGASVGDGGDTEVLGVRKTRESIEDGCECGSGRCHSGGFSQTLCRRKIHRCIDLSYLAVLGVGEVRRDLRWSFHLG